MRLTSGGAGYREDFIENPIVIRLINKGGGVYQSNYVINNDKSGYITISLYVTSYGLHKTCYTDEEFTDPPYESRTSSQIAFNWDLGIVCAGLKDGVSVK